eukprot:scaffold5281_cov127-Cylindrotheca_fusiformis.AAC.18
MRALSFLCLVFHVAQGSITIVETGQEFPSTPDKKNGKPLWKNVPYMGHLQVISTNMQLCDINEAMEVTLPNDSLPVALLATKGGCSIEEKAVVASTLINPINIVGFLIVEDDKRRMDDFLSGPPPPLETGIASAKEEEEEEEGLTLQESAVEWMPRLLRKRNENINVAVLKVSSRTILKLRRVVAAETISTKNNGGTKVILTGKSPNEEARNIFVATAVALSFICSMCFCIAACYRQGAFGQEQADDAPPPRPVRRRLTVQQVRESYPSFHYHPQEDAGGGQKNDDALRNCGTECSICLDEYVPGVRLRQLPCQHVFHSTCICRWLVERHAVCPLCKIDLYEEEEASSSSEEEETMEAAPPQETPAVDAGGSSWWSSWPFSSSSSSSSFASPGASWGRRWFSRRSRQGEGGMLTELTEPLIPSGAAEEEAQPREEAPTSVAAPTEEPTAAATTTQEQESTQESAPSEEEPSTPVEV